jgi:hypothetical protein
MGKRRGVDLPPLGVGGASSHCSRDGHAETENDAPAHATALRINAPGGEMTSESADIKPAPVQISAHLAGCFAAPPPFAPLSSPGLTLRPGIRGVSDEIERARRTGSPAFAGDDKVARAIYGSPFAGRKLTPSS